MQSTINNEISYVEIVNTNGQKKSFPKNLSFVEFDVAINIFYRNVNLQIKDIANILAINDKGVPTAVPVTLSDLYDLLKTFFFKIVTPLVDDSKAVDTFGDLPSAATTNGEIWFVKQQTGVWLLNTRKQSGTYISDGANWIHTNDPLQYWIDDQILFKDGSDLTKQLAFELEDITTATTRTVNWPDKDGIVSFVGCNVVSVESLSDFPAPVAGYIPLVDSTIYQICETVDIGANGLDFGNGNQVKLQGNFTQADGILSTKTGDFIKGDNAGMSLDRITLTNVVCDNFFNITNGGTKIFFMNSIVLVGTGAIGVVSNFAGILLNFISFAGFTEGVLFDGANGAAIIRGIRFISCSGTFIDLGTATFDTFELDGMGANLAVGDVGINVAAAGANINVNGEGFIFSCRIDESVGGDAIIGYDPLDLKWSVYGNSASLITSDRITPNGWRYYQDGETAPATLALSTTPVLVEIDGAGANSESGFLPKSIRGISQLWTGDKITPISLGDCYDLRIDIGVLSKSGGVGSLNLILDIGGGAAPTIAIVDRQVSIAKTAPFIISVGFPVFCLATFVANGGQFFLSTDAGTAVIDTRAITISRNSSGAS